MRQFSDLLYEDPRNPKLHIWLGAAFRKAGKIEYAKVQYQQVLTLTDDPDLLDLAKTSLAQIQNKLANSGQKSSDHPKAKRQPESTLANFQSDNLHKSNGYHKSNGNSNGSTNGSSHGQTCLQELNYQNIDLKINDSFSLAHEESPFFDDKQGFNGDDVTLLAYPSIQSPSNATSAIQGNNGNGLVPPPPAITLMLKKNVQKSNADPQILVDSQQDLNLSLGSLGSLEHVLSIEEITAKAESSILKDAITTIEKDNEKSRLNGNYSQKNIVNQGSQVVFAPLESQLFSEDDTAIASQDIGDRVGQAPIALEDMFTFSTLRQKITLWGTLLATIPAIGLGIAAYHGGDELLLNKVKQKVTSR
jgi:hypothetical protein